MKWKNKGKEYDEYVNRIWKKDRMYIYGIGGNAEETTRILAHFRNELPWDIILVDKDIKKQNHLIQGFRIISPKIFLDEFSKNDYVVICPFNNPRKEITELCISNGISLDDIVYGEEFIWKKFPVIYTYKTGKVFFYSVSMLPSSICNLNCRDCLNFTPYIKNHKKYTLEELKNDVDLFFGAVDEVYRFQITGGEPLLYPHLQELLEYIDSIYRNKILELEMVTNGTILPSPEFCEFLSKKNIKVYLDDYRMSLPNSTERYNQVLQMFEQHNVRFINNHVDKWFQMYNGTDYHRTDEQNAQRFDDCGEPFTTLREGKIGLCNYAQYADYAGICKADDKELFDLKNYQDTKNRELIEFKSGYSEKGYTNFCNYCNGWYCDGSKNKSNLIEVKPAIQAERNL